MIIGIPRCFSLCGHRAKKGRTRRMIDKTVKQAINGSTQQIRMCAERRGLPPLLIVQAGPGFPLLHEAAKFQQRLKLEKDFLVSYWATWLWRRVAARCGECFFATAGRRSTRRLAVVKQ